MTSFPSSTLNLSLDSSLPLIATLSSSSSSPSRAKSVYVDNGVDTDDVAVTVVTPGSRSKSNLMSEMK